MSGWWRRCVYFAIVSYHPTTRPSLCLSQPMRTQIFHTNPRVFATGKRWLTTRAARSVKRGIKPAPMIFKRLIPVWRTSPHQRARTAHHQHWQQETTLRRFTRRVTIPGRMRTTPTIRHKTKKGRTTMNSSSLQTLMARSRARTTSHPVPHTKWATAETLSRPPRPQTNGLSCVATSDIY